MVITEMASKLVMCRLGASVRATEMRVRTIDCGARNLVSKGSLAASQWSRILRSPGNH